jgi:hypothetical protein
LPRTEGHAEAINAERDRYTFARANGLCGVRGVRESESFRMCVCTCVRRLLARVPGFASREEGARGGFGLTGSKAADLQTHERRLEFNTLLLRRLRSELSRRQSTPQNAEKRNAEKCSLTAR